MMQITHMAQTKTPRRRIRLLVLSLCLLLVGGLAVGGSYAARIIMDNYTLSHADPAMAALADEAGMSRAGKLVFLRAHPQLVSDSQMQAACSQNTAANNSNGFIEQGCYVTDTHRIFLRKMPDSLHKLEVSTAAYEMLHPVYISVSVLHKTAVDQAIETSYNRVKDADLEAQVANFAKTEPGARDLELFSLLATGYTGLSSDLAQYYAPYFDNLGASVAANNQVKQLFKQSESQLQTIKAQIDEYDRLARNAYSASVVRARAGDQAGDDYYYNQYRQYLDQENAAINQYNTVLGSYNALVTEYNGSQPVSQINQAQTQSR